MNNMIDYEEKGCSYFLVVEDTDCYIVKERKDNVKSIRKLKDT